MICLGIEGSAHTFGMGIIDDRGNVLVDERTVYRPAPGKGIMPTDATQYFKNNAKKVLENVIEKFGSLNNIDLISYSAGPGLPPTLLFTANFSTELSKEYEKICLPINHMLSHVEIGRLMTNSKDPIIVYLSGGNSMILTFVGGRYRVVGETEDLALGNAIDKVARQLDLPSPGGPEIEKLALNGKYVELPYVVKGCDLSFSGIVTAATNLFKKGVSKEDISYSLQEVCFSMIAEVAERAMAHTEKSELLLVGGVAANKRLYEILSTMCEERGAKFFVVPHEYACDNPVMIGWTGILAHKSRWEPNFKEKILPKWRIDEIDIPWINI
jgi:glycoprotease/Kae1 family metallohydrolase